MPHFQTVTGHIGASTAASQHKRLTTGTAATLDALVSGGLPTQPGRFPGDPPQRPTLVWLGVETGGGAVYYTIDGSEPSATNGMPLPIFPVLPIPFPYPDQLRNTGTASATNKQIQLYSAQAQNVQALFEFY